MSKINGQNCPVSRNLFILCDLIFTYVLECDADAKALSDFPQAQGHVAEAGVNSG